MNRVCSTPALGALTALGTKVPVARNDEGVLSWKNARVLPFTGSCLA